MAAIPQTRIIANVKVADTPLVRAAYAFARAHSTDWAFNHVARAWLFGSLISARLPTLAHVDHEVLAISTLLHDLGWELDGALVSADKRFEVDGADAAREFLAREAPAGWDEGGREGEGGWAGRKAQLVWDAIALHTARSLYRYKEPEVAACGYGIWADFQGPDRMPQGLISWEEYGAIVREFPRLELMKGMKGVFCGICRSKPETTYDNLVGDWGDRFVDGYDRTGKLPADLLLACDLDDKEVYSTRTKVLGRPDTG